MKTIIIIAVSLLSVVFALPYEIPEDESREAYYLIPSPRARRQTDIQVKPAGDAVQATLSHKGTITENDNYALTGEAFASKQFHPSGPLTAGGNLGYADKNTGSGLNVGLSKTESFGSDLSAQAKYNLFQTDDRKGRLDAIGQYSRHYDGRSGTQDPNWYGEYEIPNSWKYMTESSDMSIIYGDSDVRSKAYLNELRAYIKLTLESD